MEKRKRFKTTLLLDSETIAILRAYSKQKFGSENISQVVRLIAREILENEGYTDQKLQAFGYKRD